MAGNIFKTNCSDCVFGFSCDCAPPDLGGKRGDWMDSRDW
jgi:hypothetical protein